MDNQSRVFFNYFHPVINSSTTFAYHLGINCMNENNCTSIEY